MISTKAEVEAVIAEMRVALDSREPAKLSAFVRTHLKQWNGGTPAGNVLGWIYKACVEAEKGTWDHPYRSTVWTVFKTEFPDASA